MGRSVLVNQAVELLGVSRRTVYSWIRDGRLRTFRTSGGSRRVLVESIDALRKTGGRRVKNPLIRTSGNDRPLG